LKSKSATGYGSATAGRSHFGDGIHHRQKTPLCFAAFAESFMAVEALVAITYDWLVDGAGWKLVLGPG
jgi:hypothetical protein